MNKIYTLYIHKNKTNNKMYIGITHQNPAQRWRSQGKGYKSQEKFYRAIEKYGWDGFEHIILFNNLTKLEASEKEQQLISIFDTINNGYNVSKGGSTTNHSQETIEKIRQKKLGQKHSENTKKLIRASKQKDCKPVYCVETNKTYESLGAAAAATNIDKSSIARCCTQKQITAGGFHWAFVNETPIFQQDKRKLTPVLCITTNIAYETLTAAARDLGLDASNIRKACLGKYKTTGGKQWKFLTIEEFQKHKKGEIKFD